MGLCRLFFSPRSQVNTVSLIYPKLTVLQEAHTYQMWSEGTVRARTFYAHILALLLQEYAGSHQVHNEYIIEWMNKWVKEWRKHFLYSLCKTFFSGSLTSDFPSNSLAPPSQCSWCVCVRVYVHVRVCPCPCVSMCSCVCAPRHARFLIAH